jgi:glycosyltransferase involved in cell wall biosynthesis
MHDEHNPERKIPPPARNDSPFEFRFDGSVPATRQQAVSDAAPRPLVEDDPSTHALTVLVPARNESANLPTCLESLLAQSEPGFLLGQHWHIVVIDDSSEDDTLAIAERFAADHPGIQVVRAKPLKSQHRGITGKNAALWYGASQEIAGTAKWLLFTDADTVHAPQSTHRAIVEAERHDLALLSYSPRQIATGLLQRALLPLIFSELATVYPPKKVSDLSSPVAAANGQFLLIRRQVYFDVGGHMAVGSQVLEDVALARLVKRRNAIRLRYAPEAVSARMYRALPDLIEGWTKNLALLFGNPLFMAGAQLLNFLLIFGLPLLPVIIPSLVYWQILAIGVLWLRVLLRYITRVGRSNAPFLDRILSVFALPFFAFLLIRSWQKVNLLKTVTWKGREYTT